MPGVRLAAYAKLNWTLEVGPRRPDGFHAVHTVLQRLALHDQVSLELAPAASPGSGAPERVAVRLDGLDVVLRAPAWVPGGEDNLACRAAVALWRALPSGARPRGRLVIRLVKAIPVAAGLAGGSADAAAVLRGLAALCPRRPDPAVLGAAARELGADVPFCLGVLDPAGPGLAVGTGRGDELTWHPGARFTVVLCVPPLQVAAAEAYALWDAAAGGSPRRSGPPGPPGSAAAAAVAAAAAGDARRLAAVLYNALEEPVARAYPAAADARRALERAGALGVAMSGSGPAVYGLAAGAAQAAELARRCAAELPAARVLVTEAF